jgi:transposase-like protein
MTIMANDSPARLDGAAGLGAALRDDTEAGSGPGFSWDDPRWLTDHETLERRCRTYLEALRWPDGVRCPRCGSDETGRLEARRKFYCRPCRYQFSVTAGTVLHNSHLPLWKWFLTVSAMLESESGIPSNQLLQLLGGSYKTAWFVQHRVRLAIRETTGSCADDDAATAWARSVREQVAERLGRPDGCDARLFDRPLVGAYHQLSVKHAGAYAAEMEWRAKSRANPSAFRDTILRLLETDPLEFEELIAGPTPSRSHLLAYASPGTGALSQDH